MPTDIEGLSDEELIQRYVSNYHRDVRAEFRRRMSGAGWRDVEEGLPPDNVEVLVATEYGKVHAKRRFQHEDWSDQHHSITHWQPLPSAPEEG